MYIIFGEAQHIVEKKQDKRTIRTKKAIRHAFAELFAEKPFYEISVSDIARRADINRKTFYSYYTGVYRLVEEIEDEINASFERSLSGVNIMTDLDVIISRFNAAISEEYDLCRHLLTAERNAEQTAKLFSPFTEKIRAFICENALLTPEAQEIVTEYIFAGALEVYRRSFFAENGVSHDELTSALSAVILGGISGFVKADRA